LSITVKNLALYDKARKKIILDDISCTIQNQKITLLIGKTGSGKSSFLDALSGLNTVDEGSIRYDDKPFWSGKRINKEVHQSIGNVFQYPEHQLFARTVQGEFNYSLGVQNLAKAQIAERTTSAMNQMGLPLKLTSESPLILSGGQKRRVALASTFSTRPEWLLLDEPTAGLDSHSLKRLIAYLVERKQNSAGGILIATHDLEALLPIADEILILRDGQMISEMTASQLWGNPEILAKAEIGLPAGIELGMELSRMGIPMPEGPLNSENMAQIILDFHSNIKSKPLASGHIQNKTIVKEVSPLISTLESANSQDAPESLVESLDPRSKWLCYILISIGILLQSHWLGLLTGAILTLITVQMARVSPKKIGLLIRPFLILMGVSLLLSGIRFGDAGTGWHMGRLYFSLSAALLTVFGLTQILLVMILGILLTVTTSLLKMKKGLEQALWSIFSFRRFKKPIEAFSLATSLLLRFIPVIMKESQRFSRIASARGKQANKKGVVQFRNLNAMLIPLIISILQLASDLSLAMEARGYKKIGMNRTSSYQLKWRPRDFWVVCYGAVWLIVLWVISNGNFIEP
jgi:energy-coupling factor transporter ATP-binding protein EcfA2/energy-coupling factor transporter transmembrane protein EcfT